MTDLKWSSDWWILVVATLSKFCMHVGVIQNLLSRSTYSLREPRTLKTKKNYTFSKFHVVMNIQRIQIKQNLAQLVRLKYPSEFYFHSENRA